MVSGSGSRPPGGAGRGGWFIRLLIAAYHALVGSAAIRQVGWYSVSSGVPRHRAQRDGQGLPSRRWSWAQARVSLPTGCRSERRSLPSACQTSQPDTAVQPAKEQRSYITDWGTIPHTTDPRAEKWRCLAAPPSLGRKRPRKQTARPEPHCCGAQRSRTIVRPQVTLCNAAFTNAGQQSYPLVASGHLRKPQV